MRGIVIDLKDISDSREVMESKESPGVRWFIYVLFLAVLTALLFAFVFRIDEYSKMSGEVTTQKASSSVISLSNCKIKEILVSEGQTVTAGDVLYVLDSEYAASQKEILEEKLDTSVSDLNNTRLLKKSIEQDKNLFKNSAEDSNFYYRYEQYKNGVLLTMKDLEYSGMDDNTSREETENNLVTVINSINDKKTQTNDYKSLLDFLIYDSALSVSHSAVMAVYNEYMLDYQKASLVCDQCLDTYNSLIDSYNSQVSGGRVTSLEVEDAKQESERAYAALESYVSEYLYDIRSQILLIENQLIMNSDNMELQSALSEYEIMKYSIEHGMDFSSHDDSMNALYQQFRSQYDTLYEEYIIENEEYQQLFDIYAEQADKAKVTDADLKTAKNAYDKAVLDRDSLRESYAAQIQSKLASLNEETNNLENDRRNLEAVLNNKKDRETYGELSGDKLRNEAVISINSEIDALNDSIASIKSQILELDETVKNAEVKASIDGTVTLVSELSAGDLLPAGSSLCSIIPDSGELKVTLYIPESEIAKIKVGQKIEYVIDAIPYNEFGRLTGEIMSISADSITNDSYGTKTYIAQASISANTLSNKEGTVREVKNGMLLEAKASLGSKRIIIWLLEKLSFIDDLSIDGEK